MRAGIAPVPSSPTPWIADKNFAGRERCLVIQVFAACAALVFVLAGCTDGATSAGEPFKPKEAGTLTVATATLPAPGFWVDSRAGRYSGFEGDLADEVAKVLGLDRVHVVQVPFGDIVDGKLGDADVALSQLTPTDEREKVLDFTRPYISATPAVLARKGTVASDAEALKALRWAVLERSTLLAVIDDRVEPEEAPLPMSSRDEVLDAIRSGNVDATMLDLPVAQALARSEPDEFEVLGQLSGDEGLAAALPDSSPNIDAVDSALRQLSADGTIDQLADRWFGGTGADVPLIRVTQ